MLFGSDTTPMNLFFFLSSFCFSSSTINAVDIQNHSISYANDSLSAASFGVRVRGAFTLLLLRICKCTIWYDIPRCTIFFSYVVFYFNIFRSSSVIELNNDNCLALDVPRDLTDNFVNAHKLQFLFWINNERLIKYTIWYLMKKCRDCFILICLFLGIVEIFLFTLCYYWNWMDWKIV